MAVKTLHITRAMTIVIYSIMELLESAIAIGNWGPNGR